MAASYGGGGEVVLVLALRESVKGRALGACLQEDVSRRFIFKEKVDGYRRGTAVGRVLLRSFLATWFISLGCIAIS